MQVKKNIPLSYCLFAYSTYSLISILFYLIFSELYSYENWITLTAILLISHLFFELLLIKKSDASLNIKHIFLVFIYVFNCGQIFLLGIFKNYEFYKSWNKIQIYDENIVKKTCFLFLIFTIFYTFGCINRTRYQRNYNIENLINNYKLKIQLKRMGFAILVMTLPFNLYENSLYLIESARHGYHAIFTLDIPDFVTSLGWISVLGFVLLVQGCSNKRLVAFFAVGIYAIEMLSGNRGSALIAIITFLIFYFTFTYKEFKISIFKLLFWCVIFLLLATLLSAIKRFRGYSEKNLILLIDCLVEAFNQNILFELLEEFGGTIAVTNIAQEYIRTGGHFLFGKTYIVGLFSVFINIGPINFIDITNSGSIVFLMKNHGIGGIYQSIGSSILAEFYLNFGYFLFIPSFLLGRIVAYLNESIKKRAFSLDMAYYIMPYFALIHWVRWNFNSTIRLVLWSWIIIYFLKKLIVENNKIKI